MKYESNILKRLIDTYGVVGNPRYISEIIKEFIVRGKECFPNLFTYQSDWLAHIDEFGLNPTYTVSYTGQSIYAPNTLERPVKSAILSGQTLVNLNTNTNVSQNLSVGVTRFYRLKIPYTIVANKPFTLKLNVKDSTVTQQVMMKTTHIDDTLTYDVIKEGNSTGYVNKLFTKTKDVKDIEIYVQASETGNATIENVVLLEGDHTDKDIPYFEGMTSVKMPVLTTTGKNLFDMKYVGEELNKFKPTIVENNSLTITSSNLYHYCYEYRPINFKSNRQYTLSANIESDSSSLGTVLGFRYTDGSFVYISKIKQTLTSDINKTIDCITFSYGTGGVREIWSNIQLEEGTVATSYEPFKSNILTTSEDVVLRGIGDVRDTLDCLTGEVVERITLINLSNSKPSIHTVNTTTISVSFGANPSLKANQKNIILSNALSQNGATSITSEVEGFYTDSKSTLVMVINKDKLADETIDSVKSWLSENNCFIIAETSTESVKTVDLNILDQNGQNVQQLMSFNGGTHFNTTSSEGSLLPVASVSVETDLEEVLMMCSLEGNTL